MPSGDEYAFNRLESASYGGMCDSPTLGAFAVETWPQENDEQGEQKKKDFACKRIYSRGLASEV